MGAIQFRMRRLKNLATEMGLHVLAYHLKRVLVILGTGPLLTALRARVGSASERNPPSAFR